MGVKGNKQHFARHGVGVLMKATTRRPAYGTTTERTQHLDWTAACRGGCPWCSQAIPQWRFGHPCHRGRDERASCHPPAKTLALECASRSHAPREAVGSARESVQLSIEAYCSKAHMKFETLATTETRARPDYAPCNLLHPFQTFAETDLLISI